MISTELVIAISLIALIILWFLINTIFAVSGCWERESGTGSKAVEREMINLGQFGPFVVGRTELNGGYQSYSGVALGPWLWLKRRDYGVASLVRQGFPREVSVDVEGLVMAKLHLVLSADKLHLNGQFFPCKVAFSRVPPKVLSVKELEPQKRLYRKVEYIRVKFQQEVPLPLNK